MTSSTGARASASPRPLRTIAAFEAFKGFLAMAAALGLLSLLQPDVHAAAAALIGHIGLAPGGRYPALAHDIQRLLGPDLRPLLGAVAAYAAVRLLEAYGLWFERRWGEWLGVLSGALYVPFELRHFLHQPSVVAGATILVNLAVVGYLGRGLARPSRGAARRR